MGLEAYIPIQTTFQSDRLDDVVAITLYNADGPAPSGSMTASTPPSAGSAGPLSFVGRRDGKEWQVRVPQIEVHHKTAVGCEFRITGPVERVVLRELTGGPGKHERAFEVQFDIR